MATTPPLRSEGPAQASPRPPIRDAAARAAEIRASMPEEVDFHDDFYIPPEEIPTGWDYQWRTESVIGKEDKNYMYGLIRRGWEPVPEGRHPGYIVRREGLILMERPKVLTDEARKGELHDARGAIQEMDRKLFESVMSPFERTNWPGRRHPVSRDMVSPNEIPKD